MKLITNKLLERFKEIGDQANIEDPLVIVKFFDPTGSATWYATEYNPERNTCFGYIVGLGVDEWGAFSIDELESIKLTFGLTIERDLYFDEIHFNALMKNRMSELSKSILSKEADQEPEL